MRVHHGLPLAGLSLALLVATGGCRALVELVETDPAGAGGDAGPDGGGPVGDAGSGADATIDCESWGFAPAHFDPCNDLPIPVSDLDLSDGVWTYNTDTGVLTDPDNDETIPVSVVKTQNGGPSVRLISVQAFRVRSSADLVVTGTLGLIVASWSTVVVDGDIDASGALDAAGAGGNPGECDATAATVGGDFAEGGGGGGGGGFAEPGASGGSGRDNSAPGGLGGTAVNLPAYVRGGCAGAKGGNSLGGNGGGGGGALQLTARLSLEVDADILAGGGGGRGSGGARSGGGGGGSGGMVDLEAPTIDLGSNAVIAANGGGGGGGSDNNPAGHGEDGDNDGAPAAGGDNEGMGDDGGDGGALDIAAAPGKDSGRGGGGGGGGVGFIVLHASTLMVDSEAVVSPNALAP